MISLITGMVVETASRSVVIDNHGIGYKVFATDDALHLLKIGEQKTLYIHMAVREDAQDLYGFLTKKERDFFELLIAISGIGPKSALNILSLVSVDTIVSSVRTGSVAHLVKVSGIGRKTAEKMVLELREKLGAVGDGEDGGFTAGMSSDMDAIEALRALGYETDEAREALKKAGLALEKAASKSPGGKSVEPDTGAKVKAALKELGKN